MNGYLILFVAVIYLFVGVDFLIKHNIGMGFTFVMYSLSNVGLFIASKGI